MKKLITLLASIILLSCNKSNTTPDPAQNTPGSIQYKVNGQLVVMDNANILNGEGAVIVKQLMGPILSQTRYLLNAQKDPNNVILTTVVTDSLHEINYHYDSAYNAANSGLFEFTLNSNGVTSSLYFSGDYLDVNITSYQNQRISGNFSAKVSPLSDYANRGTVLITEGILKNVPVTY